MLPKGGIPLRATRPNREGMEATPKYAFFTPFKPRLHCQHPSLHQHPAFISEVMLPIGFQPSSFKATVIRD